MIKTFKNRLKFIAALSVLSLMPIATVNASEGIDTSVVNEAWGLPTFVYGGGLNDAQINDTSDLLGIDNRENVASVDVTGNDLQNYLGTGSGNTSSMISSVLVQRENEGGGVTVLIETPEDITEITEEQYVNAAITAGVEDVTIMVASIRPVTGESALTGIYKAFDINGEELDQDRMKVAQDELETTNDIAQANEGNEGFDTARLDQAIVEIKQQLAELREKQDDLATREDIERIINDALENNELTNVISQEQIDRLLGFFERYQQTGAINSEEVKKQLENLSSNIKDRFGDLWQDAEDSGLIDKIGNFFSELWQTIRNFFN
ncbi:MAG: DUF1002 domain-containing protein [Alkalibacterium gilvum]|uniref:Uncharacterized protein YpuA, DUF1002 family n=1 Tax=Alkalibacterium gilvum TaxID=1130080 RepID=A0A1H6SNM7_9LACT|nr:MULTISPECIES: DUF1002 domain-containing protein [Alkalibacterium]MDN6294072.1 DUF1002 domain-containing protein [Alkalibacterium sp.]MDN6295680.1 DUF1002 domain-containing protein [Alkalibacterium sp.]MDN6397771.1 DUF1002 domain-containing protein [Alkalibacterium sp.]MDN6729331.1 DUF1002 domain-containing protein [Alkalibacterium sp.]SEI65192.1 Uncharacterized protein YpuA, DUF1002 family [Alkalibacterium gilvum]